MKTKGGPKKAEKAATHPKSRKAAKLVRTQHRDARIGKQKKIRDLKVDVIHERLLWFRDALLREFEAKRSLEAGELRSLAQRFCERHSEEGKAEASRGGNFKAEAARWNRECEVEEFAGPGLEVPDLLLKENVQHLREWSGDRKEIPRFRLTRVQKSS